MALSHFSVVDTDRPWLGTWGHFMKQGSDMVNRHLLVSPRTQSLVIELLSETSTYAIPRSDIFVPRCAPVIHLLMFP